VPSTLAEGEAVRMPKDKHKHGMIMVISIGAKPKKKGDTGVKKQETGMCRVCGENPWIGKVGARTTYYCESCRQQLKTGVKKEEKASPAGDGPFPLDPRRCWTCRGTGMVGGKKCPHHD